MLLSGEHPAVIMGAVVICFVQYTPFFFDVLLFAASQKWMSVSVSDLNCNMYKSVNVSIF